MKHSLKSKMNPDKIKKEFKQKSAAFRREAKENLRKAKKEMREAEKQVENYMKKNPAKAAAIAAGIGAVVGAGLAMILGGKRRR